MILVTEASSARLDAAFASAADIVCIDFEDTVVDKPAAHRLFLAAQSRPHDGELAVRLNPVSTEEGLRDLVWLASLAKRPDMVVLTMVTDAFEPRLVARILPGTPIMVIVETPEALENAATLAKSCEEVQALWLGGKDLSLSLVCDRAQGLGWARGRVVQAAAMAGIVAFDDIYRPFEDLDGLAAACAHCRSLGLHAKVTLDARQVGVIHHAFDSPVR